MDANSNDIVSKLMDTEDSDANQQYRINFFSNQKCMKELKHLLKFFNLKGFLDKVKTHWSNFIKFMESAYRFVSFFQSIEYSINDIEFFY